MYSFYRNKTKLKPKEKLRFQIISWEKFDKEIDGDEFNLEYKIYAFGVTDQHKNICVEINEFTPFFYVKIPDELQVKWDEYKTKEVEKYIRNKLFKLKDSLEKVSLVEKKDIDGFTNETNYKFLKIIVKNEKSFTRCKYILVPGQNRPKPVILSISQKNLDFKLYEGNIEPFIRFCHIQNIKLSGWVEVDKYYEEDNSSCQIDISCKWKNMNPIDKTNPAQIYILSYDIECISEKGKKEQKNIFPDPECENDIITQIGNTLHIYGTNNKIQYMFTLNSPIDNFVKDQKDIYTIVCEDEKDLLKKWFIFIRKISPDIITGYNINVFDWKYIYKRCRLLDIEYELQKMTKIHDLPASFKEEKLISNAYGENEFKYIKIPGILNSDLYTIIKREKKLPSYKLDFVAKEFIGDQKDDLTALQIFNMAIGTSEEIATVIHYCIKDCTLVINLILKLCIITNNIAMSNVTWVPMDYLESKGQQIKVHSQLAYEARLNNYLIKTIPYKDKNDQEETEKFTGATVQEAEPGAHFEPISGLDFASLYPSIMIANNYSYETIVKDKNFDNLEEVEYKDIIWTEDKDTPEEREECVRFVQNKKGILPIMLEKLWTERKSIKKEMKVVKGKMKEAQTKEEKEDLEMQYNVLDGFQLAMKVSMNSIYGFTGANFGRLPEKRIAAAVTAEGRRMIQACKEYVESEYDCKVVYGDSVADYTPIYILINNEIKVIEIKELVKYTNGNWKYREETGKYYIDLEENNIFTWTDKGWTQIKILIKHKLNINKKIIRVHTPKGIVDVTDDHSLLLENCSEISPKNCKIGDKLCIQSIYKIEKETIRTKIRQTENYYNTFNDQIELAKEIIKLQRYGYEYYINYENGKYNLRNEKFDNKISDNEIIKLEEIQYIGDVYDLTTENHHFAAGPGELIVHNTDSIYVKFFTQYEGKEHMEEVFRLSEIAADGCSNLFKRPIEMEFEKAMDPFILFSKKRYACVVYTNPHTHDYIDYKGIQVVRRDNCPYVKEKSMEIFKSILLEKDIPKSISLGRDFSKNLLDGKVKMEDLVISKSLKGYGSYEFDKQFLCKECNKRWYVEVDEKKKYAVQYWNEYKADKNLEYNLNNFLYIDVPENTKSRKHYCYTCKEETEFRTNIANIPHVALARKMKERDPYNCPHVGERVPYVFKKVNNERLLQYQRVEDPKYLMENCIPIDYNYYFEHQFKSAIETIFGPILKNELEEKMFKGIVEEKTVKKTRKIK